ncbi:MAG TPA: hypothetical protein V6C82_08400 [Chroococcales cyanobacterium]
MPKFTMIEGPFEGELFEKDETFIRGIPYEELAPEMQALVQRYAEENNIGDLDEAVKALEDSWEYREAKED